MGTCLDRGIKVVSNAGGLDPAAAPRPSPRWPTGSGWRRRSPTSSGDDLLPPARRAVGRRRRPRPLRHRRAARRHRRGSSPPTPTSGAGASSRRCGGAPTSSSPAGSPTPPWSCGPAAWHHGWARDDWDALAGAVVAGHVIECGAQATGGNYSFFTEVPGMDRHRLPVGRGGRRRLRRSSASTTAPAARCRSARSPRSCSTRSAGPRYLGPDVTARFDTIELEQAGPDRVRISGVRGRAAAGHAQGGHERARRLPQRPHRRAHRARHRGQGRSSSRTRSGQACPYRPERLRQRAPAGSSAPTRPTRPATRRPSALWRITVKDPDERKVGRAFSNAMIETRPRHHPGLLRRRRRPVGGHAVRRVPAGAGARRAWCRSTSSRRRRTHRGRLRRTRAGAATPGRRRPRARRATAPGGDDRPACRSGASSAPARATRAATPTSACSPAPTRRSAWLDGFLTVDRLQELLPEAADARRRALSSCPTSGRSTS